MEENQNIQPAFYEKMIAFTEKNKKGILIAVAVLLLVSIAIPVYNNYFLKPKAEKGIDELMQVQDYFKMDSFSLVVKGGAGFKSAVQISDEFGGTHAGNLASYYAGVSFLKIGEYDNAIKYLKKFESNDDRILGGMALAMIGDANVEKGELKEGLNYYEKAINYNINELTSPIYSRKYAQICVELKEYDKGIKLLDKVLENTKDEFTKTEMLKYKGLLTSLKGDFNS